MRFTRFIMALTAAATFFASCEKEHSNGGEKDGKKHVYIAGYYNINDLYQACYWLDGTRYDLKNSGNYASYAYDMMVENNGDFYISGHLQSVILPCYWKNGSNVVLEGTHNNSRGFIIDKIDGHIVVGGTDDMRACVWVDGTQIQLCSEKWSEVTAMAWTDKGLVFEGFLTSPDYKNVYPKKWILPSLSGYPKSADPFNKDVVVDRLIRKGSITYALCDDQVYNYDTKEILFSKKSGFKIRDFVVSDSGTIICAGYLTGGGKETGTVYMGGKKLENYKADGDRIRFESVYADGDDVYVTGSRIVDSHSVAIFMIGPDGKENILSLPSGAESMDTVRIIVK